MSSPSRLRALLGAAAATLLGGGLLVTGAGPASAHATLISVSPRDGATLTSAPATVDLTFDEPVSARFATLVVTGPDGTDVGAGPTRVSGSHVTATLATGLTSGDYRVAFRVVSDDGHPVSGQSRFTLQLATDPTTPAATGSSGAARPSPTPTAAAPGSLAGEDSPSWLSQHLPALAGALLLVVLGAGALAWDRRRR